MKRLLSLGFILSLIAWCAATTAPASLADTRADCAKIHDGAKQLEWASYEDDNDNTVIDHSEATFQSFSNSWSDKCWRPYIGYGGWYTRSADGNTLNSAEIGAEGATYHIIYFMAATGADPNVPLGTGQFDSVDVDGVEQPAPEGCEALAGTDTQKGIYATRYRWDPEARLMTKVGTWPAFHCFSMFDNVIADKFNTANGNWQQDPASGLYKRFFQEPVAITENNHPEAGFIDRADMISGSSAGAGEEACAANTNEGATAYSSVYQPYGGPSPIVEDPSNKPESGKCLDEITMVTEGWYKSTTIDGKRAWEPTKRTSTASYKVFYTEGGTFDLRSGILFDGEDLGIEAPEQAGCVATVGEFGAESYRYKPDEGMMEIAGHFQPFHCFEQELTDSVSGNWRHPVQASATQETISSSWENKFWGDHHEFLRDPVEDRYIDVIDIVKPMIPNQEPGA